MQIKHIYMYVCTDGWIYIYILSRGVCVYICIYAFVMFPENKVQQVKFKNNLTEYFLSFINGQYLLKTLF